MVTSAADRPVVLVIDDASDVRALLALVLERAGYRVVPAQSGEEGLALLARAEPALICVDYMLPGIDGPQVVRRIRAEPRFADTPILLLTAETADGSIEQAFAAGADDYLIKPFDRRIIVARIGSAIRAAEDQRRARRSEELTRQRDHLVREFEEAARVQRSLATGLPRCFPHGTIMGATIPCQHIGGDSLAVLDGPGGATTAVLVDVSGHGAGAALMAAALIAEIRLLAAARSLVACFEALNQQLTAARGDYYACVGAVQIAGERATIINAGLPPICVLRGGRTWIQIAASGAPPGLFAGSSYEATELVLEPDDRVVVLSDGLTEPFGVADDVEPCLAGLGLRVPRGVRTSDDFAREIRIMLLGRQLPDDATLIVVDYCREVAGACEVRL